MNYSRIITSTKNSGKINPSNPSTMQKEERPLKMRSHAFGSKAQQPKQQKSLHCSRKKLHQKEHRKLKRRKAIMNVNQHMNRLKIVTIQSTLTIWLIPVCF